MYRLTKGGMFLAFLFRGF